MTQRKPIVIADGRQQQIQSGDTLCGISIEEAFTNTSGAKYGIHTAMTWTPSGAATSVNNSGSKIYALANGSGSLTTCGMIGQEVAAEFNASGKTIDALWCNSAQVVGTDGSITVATGQQTSIYADGSTIGTAYGHKVTIQDIGGGSIGTAYGTYIDDITSHATTPWAVYTAGTTPSQFGGPLISLKAGDSGDRTKIVSFDVSGVTTGTTRTVTLPDASGTMTLLGNTSTGSGSVVLATSPTLVTPNIGVATATTVNGVSITGSGTLATGSGNTLTLSGTSSINQNVTTTGTPTFQAVTASNQTGTAKTLVALADTQSSGGIKTFATKFIAFQATTTATSTGFLNQASSGGLFVEERSSGASLTVNSIGALLPSGWQFQVKGVNTYNLCTLYDGNTIIGGNTTGTGATSNLVMSGGATSPVLGAATADLVSIAGVDNGAGNREFQVQPESGGFVAYGADTLRRIPNANRGVDDRIKSVTTTDATQTTLDTIAITASSTYTIESCITARRTGGTSGTADDGASYTRRATYTTKAGVVTLMGSVQTIGTDAEDQAGWDATMDISGTNVRVRVTGAANNNISWQARTVVHRISS